MSEPVGVGSTIGSTMDNMPWWIKAVMLFGSTFGMPALILGFYLAQDAGVVGNPVEQKLEEVRGEIQELKGLIVMQCVTHAATDAERKSCFHSGTKGE